MTDEDTLTPDEELFVEEYLIDRNATAAYRRAHPGTKYNTAATTASLLLKKPNIRKAIRLRLDAVARRCRVSAAKVVRGFARLAFYDIGAAFDLTRNEPVLLPPREIPFEVRQAITAVKVKRRVLKSDSDEVYEVEEWEYKFADKLSALDKLSRHLGLYKDMPPLEALLAILPPGLGDHVRAALAQAVLEGGGPPGGGPPGGGGGGPPLPGPADPVPGGRPDGGPVAGGVPVRPESPADAPLLPPGREDDGGGGPDPGPLFE